MKVQQQCLKSYICCSVWLIKLLVSFPNRINKKYFYSILFRAKDTKYYLSKLFVNMSPPRRSIKIADLFSNQVTPYLLECFLSCSVFSGFFKYWLYFFLENRVSWKRSLGPDESAARGVSRQQAAAEPGAGLQETGGQPADAVARETSHHDNNMSVVLRRERFF